MAVTSEKYFPFDSDDINGQYTREYLADDFARYFRAFISSGTFMDVPDNLQVIANGDMTVTLRPGSMIIDGYRYDNVSDIIIPITPPDGVMSRIDRISATWSNPDDDIHYTLQEGDFSYNPVPPACRRTADYKDYVVADIMVTAGAISIRQSDITDQRLNSEVCGLAVPFGNLDTAALYDQIKADLQYFREMGEEKFTAWFEQIRNQLTEDAAGNLQSQIGNLEHLLTVEKMDLVSALNEICRRVNSSSEMLQKTIGDAFSEEKTYSIGDYAIYENTLYRFIAAKTAGAWNPAAAEAVTVAGEICKLNGNLTALSDKMVNSIVVRTVMWSGVVQAGGAGRPSVTVPTVKGYTPIAAIPQDLAAWFFYSRCSLSGNTWNATICSTYEDGQPHSLTAYACILYVKNS